MFAQQGRDAEAARSQTRQNMEAVAPQTRDGQAVAGRGAHGDAPRIVVAPANIREQGYLERNSAQSFGVVDISFPILGPDKTALATLTCPYIRRIDRHIGPDIDQVRQFLRDAAKTLSFSQSNSHGKG